MRPGVVYEFTCQTCVSEGREDKQVGRYVGESARALYDRAREHMAALRTLNKESPLVEHHLKEHSSIETPSFSLKAIKFFKANLMRQATEAVLIQEKEGTNLLNRRGEWGQNLPQ